MQPLIVPVYPDLSDPGQSLTIEKHLDEPTYSVGSVDYVLENGIDIDLVFTNTGEAVLLTGMARAKVLTECARCLAPVKLELAGEVEGYYLLTGAEPAEEADIADDEFEYVSDDETIDASAAVLAALVVETPVMIVCREDCKGLCPHCGADLNEGPCGCEDASIVSEDNPFAALKDLKFDDTEPTDN